MAKSGLEPARRMNTSTTEVLEDLISIRATLPRREIPSLSAQMTEGPSPEGDGFGRHKHAQSAEADFRSRPDRRLSAAVLRRFRSLRDLLKASPKGEGFHPSPMGTLNLLAGMRTHPVGVYKRLTAVQAAPSWVLPWQVPIELCNARKTPLKIRHLA